MGSGKINKQVAGKIKEKMIYSKSKEKTAKLSEQHDSESLLLKPSKS